MILDTAISSINLQQWFSKLSYALMILWYKTPIIYLLQLIYDMTLRILSMNKATACPLLEDPPPMRIPGAARRTPRHYPRLWILCYYIVFFLFCHLCYSISAYPKTHKPRGRASDVSTISTCFSLCYHILPTPPPISWERLGVSLSCTCAAFSPLC